MNQPACVKLFSAVFPFWDKLSQKEKDTFCQATSYKLYKKGEILHGGSGNCTGGILIKSGSVRVYLLSEQGREVTLYRLSPGEMCMLSASCVLQSITFDVFVDAQADTECYILNGKTFADLAAHNLYVQNFALETAVSRFSDVIWVMQQILFMSYDQRLALFLYTEMEKAGSPAIRMTQAQIAQNTGSAREVVSRMLSYFAAEGIVRPVRGGVQILDAEKLKKRTQ